jgi:hypothetical protein
VEVVASHRLKLLELLARLAMGQPVLEDGIAWALECVIAGEDDEPLGVIAGMNGDAPRDELEPWLRHAAVACGVRVPSSADSGSLVRLAPMQYGAELARAIADRRVSLIEGSWKLAVLRSKLDFGRVLPPDIDELLLHFTGVSSQSDHFAAPRDRIHWNPEALRKQDEEAHAFEESMLPGVLRSCRELAAALEREVARISEPFFTSPSPAREAGR